MAVMRVIPYAYPTIQGQATNENPTPGGGDNVDYLNLDKAVVNVWLEASMKSGGNYWPGNFQAKVSGVTVNDMTGLRAIYRLSGKGITVKAPNLDYDYGSPSKSVAVGTTYNREINIPPISKKGTSSAFPVGSGTITGTYKFAIEVVDALGNVVQTKTYEGTLEFEP